MFIESASSLTNAPKRIISLVPSQTALLHSLGLEEEVIGITKFCIHPREWFDNKTRIGGTKALNIDKINELQPDLIIANKEENVKDQVEMLAEKFPVWLTDVNNLNDAIQMITDIGSLTHKNNEAENINSRIIESFSSIKNTEKLIPAVYLIWKNPYMTIGGDTFIHDMMEKAGFENVFGSKKRYPELTIDNLRQSGCKLILLSSEPYPFKEKHKEELESALPGVKAVVVDGELFSWYGSHLLSSPRYFNELYQKCVQAL
jgi:ABC-type Fe3+-hydroxamate transport system substrate-binding protein